MNKPVLKWAPSYPVRAKDNLISAVAIEKNQLGFKPTYEREPKLQMNFLLSNEYMRMWYKQRGQYEKDVYSREETIKEESKIKRRVVQRMMTYRKPLKNDFIDDFIRKKRGKDTHEQILTPDKMKYKPDCMRKKGSEDKTKTDKANISEEGSKSVKGGKNVREQSGSKIKDGKEPKGGNEQKNVKNKTRKDEENDCGVADEVILVCANSLEQDCCDSKNK